MNWIRTAFREVFGLFVDDVPFTLAILIWIAVVCGTGQILPLSLKWDAPLLGAGLAIVLMASVVLTAMGRHSTSNEEPRGVPLQTGSPPDHT
jgi:hypothetical protein